MQIKPDVQSWVKAVWNLNNSVRKISLLIRSNVFKLFYTTQRKCMIYCLSQVLTDKWNILQIFGIIYDYKDVINNLHIILQISEKIMNPYPETPEAHTWALNKPSENGEQQNSSLRLCGRNSRNKSTVSEARGDPEISPEFKIWNGKSE